MQRVAEFFNGEPQYLLKGDTIGNNNVETTNNSAIGNTATVNNTLNPDVFKSVMQNLEQISKLMEMQNKLIEKLLKTDLNLKSAAEVCCGFSFYPVRSNRMPLMI